MKAIIGQKIGMTRILTETAETPVTVVYVENNIISQIKSLEKDGYWGLQLGYPKSKNIRKPQKARLPTPDGVANGGQAKLPKTKIMANYFREVPISQDEAQNLETGQELNLKEFSVGQKVWVRAVSKGKGFSGVIKRHHFSRGPMTHGSEQQRRPGSIGSAFPQRVLKGKKMAGRMGGKQATIKNLEIIDVQPENKLLLIRGAIPGPNRSLVLIGEQNG